VRSKRSTRTVAGTKTKTSRPGRRPLPRPPVRDGRQLRRTPSSSSLGSTRSPSPVRRSRSPSPVRRTKSARRGSSRSPSPVRRSISVRRGSSRSRSPVRRSRSARRGSSRGARKRGGGNTQEGGGKKQKSKAKKGGAVGSLAKAGKFIARNPEALQTGLELFGQFMPPSPGQPPSQGQPMYIQPYPQRYRQPRRCPPGCMAIPMQPPQYIQQQYLPQYR